VSTTLVPLFLFIEEAVSRPASLALTADLSSVIYRADYHKVLSDKVLARGGTIRLDSPVVRINFESNSVVLSNGTEYTADVIVGADGLRSQTRDCILGYHKGPVETGDMAYRITIPRERMTSLNSPYWSSAINDPGCFREWTGPLGHAVFSPVRNRTIWILVLVR